MKATRWFLVIAVLLSVTVSAHSGELKVAVADIGRVILAHPKTQTDQLKLEQQAAEYEEERATLLAAMNKLKEEFLQARREAGSLALSKDSKRAKISLAEQKLEELTGFERTVAEKIRQRKLETADMRSQMRRLMVAKIRTIIDKYAKKHKIDLVLDSSAMSLSGIDIVIYFKDKMDITEDLVKLAKKK